MTEDFVEDELQLASVDKTYRPYGLAKGNVYVTGAGLFPTVGSWNRMFHLSTIIPAPILT